eukprot:scaffold15514_cov129-Cylindrotheca_fusiformis.AAC.19
MERSVWKVLDLVSCKAKAKELQVDDIFFVPHSWRILRFYVHCAYVALLCSFTRIRVLIRSGVHSEYFTLRKIGSNTPIFDCGDWSTQ